MKLSTLDQNSVNESIVEDILFSIPPDDLQKGDLIFVFGTSVFLEERMDKAIELYFQKRAPKMLLSGGRGSNGSIEESLLMRKYALERGVLEKDILIEMESSNTTENVLGSLLVLQKAGLLQGIRRILIVTSIYHVKRCILTLSRYMPNWIAYSYCPAGSIFLQKENWKNSSNTRKRLFLEVYNMLHYVKKGIIDDCEIS